MGPVRIIQRRARDGDQIGLAGRDDLFRLVRIEDHAHGHDDGLRHGDLDGLGEAKLIPGLGARDVGAGDVAARRQVQIVVTQVVHRRAEGHDLLQRDAALDPVRAVEAHAKRLCPGPGVPHGLGHAQGEPSPVLGRAAVLVRSLIGEGRQELAQQIAVRRVDLHQIETRPVGSAGGVGEGRHDPVHVRLGHLDGRVPTLLEGEGRRAERRPGALLLRQGLPPFPRRRGRGLASRMGQLDADGRVGIGPQPLDDVGEGRLLGVVPQAGVVRRDPPGRLDARRLDDHQAGA